MKRRAIKTANLWRMHTIVSRHRARRFMRKIERLNQSPDVCWTELVCWDALYHGQPLARLVAEHTSLGCKQDAARNGSCYCGKFATLEKADNYSPAFIVGASR